MVFYCVTSKVTTAHPVTTPAFCLHAPLPFPSTMVPDRNIEVNVLLVIVQQNNIDVEVPISRLPAGHSHSAMDQRFRPPHRLPNHLLTATGDRARRHDIATTRVEQLRATPSLISDGFDSHRTRIPSMRSTPTSTSRETQPTDQVNGEGTRE